MRRLWLSVIWIFNVMVLPASSLWAQTGAEVLKSKTIDERLTELEQEVRVLKRLKEIDQDILERKDAETPVVTASKDGFGLKSRDGNFQIKLKGQVQADSRFYADDDEVSSTNTFLLRRVRPSLEGTAFKYFDFRLMPDFGSGNTVLQDAWIDFKYWKKASLRVGKFKSPVSLERLQSDPNATFVESSLVSNLVPNRDVGVDLHGNLFNGALNYDLGIFNGTVDGSSITDSDNHDDKDVVARIFTLPFKNTDPEVLNGLGVGIGASAGKSHGSTATPNLPTFRSGGQQTIFSYVTGAFADGTRYRIVPQAYYYYGPFGVMGEFARSSQEVKRGATETEVENSAWQIQSSYVLTGEKASYNGAVPRDNFDPANGKWGALELKGRFGWFYADETNFAVFANPLTSAEEAMAWTLGFNWYLNKNLKLMTDFEQTFFHGGRSPGGNREKENTLLSRFQIAF